MTTKYNPDWYLLPEENAIKDAIGPMDKIGIQRKYFTQVLYQCSIKQL